MSRFDNWPKGAWSHSKWAELRRCPKAHDLKYNKRLYRIGKKPDALLIGEIFHRGVELVTIDALAGIDTTWEHWEAAMRMARKEHPKDVKVGLEATRLLAAYAKHYGPENAGYEPEYTITGTEEVLTGGDLHVEHGGYAAIADAILEDIHGPIIVETKTAARMPSGTETELKRAIAMQDQVLGLAYCGYKRFGSIPRVMRNIVTKTNQVGFLRLLVDISDEALEKWERDQLESEQLIGLTCANRDACAPPMGFICNYFEHCHGTSTGMDQETVDAMYYSKGQRIEHE